ALARPPGMGERLQDPLRFAGHRGSSGDAPCPRTRAAVMVTDDVAGALALLQRRSTGRHRRVRDLELVPCTPLRPPASDPVHRPPLRFAPRAGRTPGLAACRVERRSIGPA